MSPFQCSSSKVDLLLLAPTAQHHALAGLGEQAIILTGPYRRLLSLETGYRERLTLSRNQPTMPEAKLALSPVA